MPVPDRGWAGGLAPLRRGVARILCALLLLSSASVAHADDEDCPATDPAADAAETVSTAPAPKASPIKVVGDALWNEAKRYGSDTAALVVAPFHWDATDRQRAVGAAAMIGGSFWADHAVYELFQKNRSGFTNAVSSATTWYGGGGAFGVAAALVGVGLLSGNDNVRDMGRDALEAALIAGFFTNVVIKPVAGRWRPSQSNGETIFEPFSGHTSFTSGHATQAFAVSSVIAMRSPGWIIPTIAYGLAFVVACDRINDRAHFLSDVVTGALFATATGRFLVRRHQKETGGIEPDRPKTTIEVVPIADGAALRIGW